MVNHWSGPGGPLAPYAAACLQVQGPGALDNTLHTQIAWCRIVHEKEVESLISLCDTPLAWCHSIAIA